MHVQKFVYLCTYMVTQIFLPVRTSWPDGKGVTVVAAWTPLVRLPVLSPSPTFKTVFDHNYRAALICLQFLVFLWVFHILI